MFQTDGEKNVVCLDETLNELTAREAALAGIGFSSSFVRVNERITRFELIYKNLGTEKPFIPVFQTVAEGTPDFYMIPCVVYNGNEWGDGQEPKGTEKNGEPWVFPSDRVGLPGCAVLESEGKCRAIFAGKDTLSADCSVSLIRCAKKTVLRIYFSHIESPLSYLRKFEYGEPVVRFARLKEGEEKRYRCYVYEADAEEPNYGSKELFDFVNLHYLEAPPLRFSPRQIKEGAFRFLSSLTEKTEYGFLSNMGLLPNGEHRLGDGNSRFIFRKFGKYEIGWCGQNVTAAEMYLRAYAESGNADFLERGEGILDTWLKRTHETGAVSCQYDVPFSLEEKIDSCNEGWLLYKLAVCCRLLKGMGRDATRYENAIKGICGFYLKYFPENGFPQIALPDGTAAVERGCAGTMLVAGFLAAYELLAEKDYLRRAESAFEFYYENYLSRSVAAGGALDTYCIDKESAGPLLRSALTLYEITKETDYLRRAENIAHYLMTWCFYHDVVFEENSDCARLRVRTSGGTSVSAAHHHIDCWGLFYAPDLYRLYGITKNAAYLAHARVLWAFTVQYVSDGTLRLHGMTRPLGAQNEAVLQCGWHALDERKGQLNDWLVAWVKTFQLDAYYALKNTDFFE